VEAVLLTGSVAQGVSDAASDLDLLVYLREPLNAQAFEAEVTAARASGGEKHYGKTGEAFSVFHYVEGRKIDIGFEMTSSVDEMIDRLLVRFDPSPALQLAARGILEGTALRDNGVVERFKRQLSQYPLGLAEATVRTCLMFMPKWVLIEMGVKRGEALVIYECVLAAVLNMCGALAALNGQYHPGKLKGIERFARHLTICPTDFVERAKGLFGLSLDQCVESLDALIRDLFDLVDIHLPTVDTGFARERFAMRLVRP
jgi:hypothetical protein